MNTLFEKLRASFALDRGGKPRNSCETDAARRFEESVCALDHELRESRTNADVPNGLHASIMRAVQKSSVETEPAANEFWLRRLATIALVLTIGVGVFWSVNRPSINGVDGLLSAEAPPSFAVAFDRGHELTQAAPKAVLGPLSGEMELLNRDFQNAMNFLAANMP